MVEEQKGDVEMQEQQPDKSIDKSDSQILKAQNLYMQQVQGEFSNWQAMCEKLMALFQIYSDLEHPDLGAKIEGVKEPLQKLTESMAARDQLVQERDEERAKREKLLEVCQKQKQQYELLSQKFKEMQGKQK